jgi:hypothetical protein
MLEEPSLRFYIAFSSTWEGFFVAHLEKRRYFFCGFKTNPYLCKRKLKKTGYGEKGNGF